ncbi:RsmB/NOP family class I SAM-dependent RNA methyltransferase [Acidisoma silvae]|uniref:RsmB/NOP family class I SAM-dependent RNA methyltransferase n=1 Tax=Acidisoma silvae TaxID=2802396 RepID=UPI001D0BB456|nr:transcription antitermination factor NusB [Acidisoma silvae]
MKHDDNTSPLSSDPTRSAALSLLSAVLDRHRSMEEALDSLPSIDSRDKAAAHRLAATALRRRGTIDTVLDPYLKRVPPPLVMHVLRLGAAGLLFLDTPAHAAVATAVGLARAKNLEKFAGLVNAVLRRVSESGQAALEELDSPRLDTPPWLWKGWDKDARAIAIAHQTEAPLDISLLPGEPVPEDGQLLPTGSVRFPAGTRVADIPAFVAGRAWVQDAAAALPARILNAQPGEHIADLCAAPGGKTAQMAAAGAHVTAIELLSARVPRLTANLERLGLSARIITGDAATWKPEGKLDAILLDAPCSATGTIRRHPDVPYLKQQGDVQNLAAMQDRLLTAAVGLLQPGGRLVYAVCSMQPQEGPDRIAAALSWLPVKIDPIRRSEVPGLESAVTREGYVRTHPALWPEEGGLDGFFIARLRRL